MSDAVSWIENDVAVEDFLTDEMREEVCREDGTLHRLYQALSPWPSAILPVHKFYQAILHAPDAPLDLHNGEFVATYVAILNRCAYARAHHGENYCATAASRAEAELQLDALERDDLSSAVLSDRQRAIANYTRKLTQTPDVMEKSDVVVLRAAGLRSDEIVHVNQIAASFGYWTRMINGLGISLGAENIGLAHQTLSEIVIGNPMNKPVEKPRRNAGRRKSSRSEKLTRKAQMADLSKLRDQEVQLRLADGGQTALIHQTVLKILSEIGVVLEHDATRDMLTREYRCKMGDDGYLRMPPDLVERALETVPGEIRLYDLNGNLRVDTSSRRTSYCPGHNCVRILDRTTGETARLHVGRHPRNGDCL